MNYLIGTDEAGYGPNLGPLVISASVWQAPEHASAGDLYRLLRAAIVPAPREVSGRAAAIAIADSKSLYPSPKGLFHLERGLLTCLALLGRRPKTWGEYWQAVGADPLGARLAILWYADFDRPLPIDVASEEIERLSASIAGELAAAGVRLVEIHSRVLFEAEFNRRVDRDGSKGATLSHATLDLLAEVSRMPDARSIQVICDKHGGRNAYQHLLSEHFPDWLIEVHGESRDRSIYRFGPRDRRMEVCFQVKAESYLPTALASMASKYLRELSMAALNHFWSARVPRLRPTAGYPQDARRFLAEIAAVQADLGIGEEQLWRKK